MDTQGSRGRSGDANELADHINLVHLIHPGKQQCMSDGPNTENK